MPTQAFTDSDINLEVVTICSQNSCNEETDTLKSKCPRETERRKRRKRRDRIILTGFVVVILTLLGIIGWLIWLTWINLHPNPIQLPLPQLSTETTVVDHIYTESTNKPTVDGLSGIAMVLDVASLFDKTITTLHYQTTSSKFSGNGIQYNQDGSFKILKSGHYLLHSKLSLTNEDFTKTKSFQQCIVVVANDAPLECDQGSVSPRTKTNSQIWRFEYLEQNQILKVMMTNKDLVYRDKFYNRIQIIELPQGT